MRGPRAKHLPDPPGKQPASQPTRCRWQAFQDVRSSPPLADKLNHKHHTQTKQAPGAANSTAWVAHNPGQIGQIGAGNVRFSPPLANSCQSANHPQADTVDTGIVRPFTTPTAIGNEGRDCGYSAPEGQPQHRKYYFQCLTAIQSFLSVILVIVSVHPQFRVFHGPPFQPNASPHTYRRQEQPAHQDPRHFGSTGL